MIDPRALRERDARIARYDENRLPPMRPVRPATGMPHIPSTLIAIVLIGALAVCVADLAHRDVAGLVGEAIGLSAGGW